MFGELYVVGDGNANGDEEGVRNGLRDVANCLDVRRFAEFVEIALSSLTIIYLV